MLIYCPKCFTAYQIDEDLISDKSRKVKCSNCGDVFDAGSLVEKTVDNNAFDNNIVDEWENVSEENAFEALAAMMREADIDDSEITFLNNDRNNTENEPSVDEKTDDDISDNDVADFDTTPSSDEKINDNAEVSEPVEAEERQKDVIIDEEAKEDGQTTDEINIENIYERLSEHASCLIEREKSLPLYEKIWLKFKEVLGFHFRIKWSYIFIGVFVFAGLSLFNNRYEVVRKLPFMNSIYKAFGIKAKIAGEGLEFQNVVWDYVFDGSVKKMEVKGFISNITDEVVDVPVIHIEVLDAKTSLLQSINHEINEKELASGNRASLQVVIENLPPTAKYIYLTFIDKQ